MAIGGTISAFSLCCLWKAGQKYPLVDLLLTGSRTTLSFWFFPISLPSLALSPFILDLTFADIVSNCSANSTWPFFYAPSLFNHLSKCPINSYALLKVQLKSVPRRLSTSFFRFYHLFFAFISLLICLTFSLEHFISLFTKIIISRIKRTYKLSFEH